MEINIITENKVEIAVISSVKILINDVQSAVDFIATIRYTTPCDCIIINKMAFGKEFFNLKTGLAGNLLQKFINHRMKIAIIGDYSGYSSSSLKDFIYECNNGQNIFFLSSEEQAIEKLTAT